ncbi:MAG: zinc dependent phospholipase C family protein [Acidobacteria bacterium]|nr:zinc dependent phospholipase C family protein [Acidobacteriota bacterium]
MATKFKSCIGLLVCLCFVFTTSPKTFAYSVLTHQAIIDSVWQGSLQPLLLKRFPTATAAQLKEAHAYAYGGAIIQDMGYYPFGSKLFTDLTHYVRSGEFIESLLEEATNLNEYAFAVGALAHYAADNNGHALGINRAVPLEYPKLRARFGNEVTYAEDPASHLKTEFGFDVLQVAKGRYAPDAYHDFIGFKVSKEVLERAFVKTYGMELTAVFEDLDLAIGTYRRAVSHLIPEMTKVAWELKKDEIEKSLPGITREKFLYNLSQSDYEKEFGKGYEKPGLFAKTSAWFFRVVPKVGPFKALAFKAPTPAAEKLFMASFNTTLARYRTLLQQTRNGKLVLENRDFDTGKPTHAGEYQLADDAYSELLIKLAKQKFAKATPALRHNIIEFYRNLNAPLATKRDKDEWQKTLAALNQLKASTTISSRQ